MTVPKIYPRSRPWDSHSPNSGRTQPIPLKRRIKRWSRYFFLRFIRLKGGSESVARGLAVGAFAGMFPFFGGQMFMAVILAVLVRGNKVAAMAATWISNPFTYIPVFGLNYYIGRNLLNAAPTIINQQNVGSLDILLKHGQEFAEALLLGSCIMGILVGIAAYFIGHKLSLTLKKYYRERYRRNHRKRLGSGSSHSESGISDISPSE